jgi:hypothetical protein
VDFISKLAGGGNAAGIGRDLVAETHSGESTLQDGEIFWGCPR